MHSPKLSVFDLDNTLVKGNSSFQFCKYLFKKGVYPFSALCYSAWAYFEHDYIAKTSLLDLHQKIFNKLLIGRPLEFFSKHVTSFIETCLSEVLYTPAIEALRLSQHLGHYTVILSNSPSFLVEEVARFFGVDAWGATEYQVDKDQKLCHIATLMQGEDKAQFVRKMISELGIKKEDVTAYSDSYLDLPFLLSAGNSIAVNPDRKLRQVAMQKQWSII